jgi:hypothetical protein
MTTTRTPVLLSVNVGLPKNVSWQGRTVYTGIWKHPVDGPAMVRRLNIDGDGQGDTRGHGGEQRAVLVYQLGSYRHWRRHVGRGDLGYGTFGENLTVDGLPDDEVCIGDRICPRCWSPTARPGAQLLADLRGYWRHAGPGHAAAAHGGPRRARGLVAARGARSERPSVRGRGP